MSPMPAWLAKRRGPTENAHLETCPRCRQHILRALVDGLDTRADLTPIDQPTEIAALAAGRTTYDAWRTGSPPRIELVRRDPPRIRANTGQPVLADHRCGQPLPAAPRTPPRPTTPTPAATGDQPPF